MRILVADDDEMARRMLDLLLTDAGYDVTLACDGLEALAALEEATEAQEPPPIFLLDWVMPGLTGIEVCRRVRGLGANPYILLVTARSSRQDALDGLDAGADDLLAKPYAPEELIARVRVAERVVSARAPSSGLALEALAEALRGPGGAVEVRSGDAVGQVLVREGRVAWAHVAAEPGALLALLGRGAALSDEDLRDALEERERAGRSFDEVILGWGLVEQARLRERLRAWIARKLDAILRLPDPTVRFVAEVQAGTGIPTFPPDQVLPEEARRALSARADRRAD